MVTDLALDPALDPAPAPATLATTPGSQTPARRHGVSGGAEVSLKMTILTRPNLFLSLVSVKPGEWIRERIISRKPVCHEVEVCAWTKQYQGGLNSLLTFNSVLNKF